jgi:ribosomal protein S18 acetylase RimI-like enzyme
MRGGLLHVLQRHPGIERGSNERVSQRVRANVLGDPGPAGNPPHDPGGAVPVHPPLVPGKEQRTFTALAGGQVDGPGGARGERDGDDLAALAGDHQGAVAALEAQVLDVRARASEIRACSPRGPSPPATRSAQRVDPWLPVTRLQPCDGLPAVWCRGTPMMTAPGCRARLRRRRLREQGGALMSALSVSALGEAERERAYATLVLAFAADPVERWLYPQPWQYLSHFPRFLAAFGGRAFAARTAWSLGQSAAVALWLPPGTEADGDAVTTSLAQTVATDKHHDMFAVLGQMDAAHPRYPHWYLPWFAVDIALQGTGLGTQLMEHCLRVVDATPQPAYLETPNPCSISLYQRHGFEVTGQAQAGTCPPITFMLRAAR